jgi:hypothetical protein
MKSYTIETSEVTYIELMLLAKKSNLDFIEIIKDVMAIYHENNAIYLLADEYIKMVLMSSMRSMQPIAIEKKLVQITYMTSLI